MRSATDVLSALLAVVFVAVAIVMATGVGLRLAPAHAPDAAPVYAHHHDH
jgi:hypothetical protein